KLIVELSQSGCQAGLVTATNDDLDKLVTEGVRKGHLAIHGRIANRRERPDSAISHQISNLDQYMLAYGSLLCTQAGRSLNPLHVPVRDPLSTLDLVRSPFDAQSHVIEATRKALNRQKALLLVGEMGVGKTMIGMAAIHSHAAKRPYRALVF